jgi:hypothetical protein
MSPFTKEEGSEFLMKLLHRNHYSADEIQSASDFTEELDGLPLAIQLVGTKISTLGKSIRKSVDQYRRNPLRIHQKDKSGKTNLYYGKRLDKVWEEVFAPLPEEEDSEHVLAIMGVLCLMAADDIPEDLFRPDDLEALPPSLRFCEDEDRYGFKKSNAFKR